MTSFVAEIPSPSNHCSFVKNSSPSGGFETVICINNLHSDLLGEGDVIIFSKVP